VTELKILFFGGGVYLAMLMSLRALHWDER